MNKAITGQVVGFGKLQKKGDFVIPAIVRESLKMKPGDNVLVIKENGRFFIERGDIDVLVKSR